MLKYKQAHACARFLMMAMVLVATEAVPAAEPSLPQAARIHTLVHENKLDEAVMRVEAWTRTSANDANAWYWAGRVYAQEAMHSGIFSMPSWASKMRKAYERSVDLDGGNVDARIGLLQFYARAPRLLGGDSDKAKLQAQAIAKLDAAYGHLAFGLVAESADDSDAAEREYREAIEAAPDDSRVRLNLGLMLSGQKKWPAARALYSDFLERHPDDALALYQYGRIAAVSGEKLQSGLTSLDRFLAIAGKSGVVPDDISIGGAHWRKGQILDRLGRRDAALQEVRLGLQLDPQLSDAKKDLKRLGG